MARIYLAGPMRGLPLYNFPAFDAAEKLLRGQGWEVYNPARADRELDGFDPETGANLQPIEVYLHRDFAAILDGCTAIAMLPEWRKSDGARKEYAFATSLGLEVIGATTGVSLLEAGNARYLALLGEMEALHRAKAAGYSGIGAVDTWANFREAEKWGVSPLGGCMVRLGDKYRRIQNILRNPENEQVGETVIDTLMDMAAYSLIGICLWEEANGPD
jgi:hypothetical protein